MGLIREPLDVDFVVDPRPLTEKEKKQINEYIRAYKARHAKKRSNKGTLRKSGKQKDIPPGKRLSTIKKNRAS